MSTEEPTFKLSQDERENLQKLKKRERDSRIYSRYLAILWLDQGHSFDEVAARLEVDPSTIRKWLDVFKKREPKVSLALVIKAIAEI